MKNKNHSVPNLGTLPDKNQRRDAIHIAVAPVVAGEELEPGAKIYVEGDRAFSTISDSRAIGVVDPFLTTSVKAEQTFWLLLIPQSITSLRHEWTHPAFEPEAPIASSVIQESRRWLDEFAADKAGKTGDQIIEIASAVIRGDSYSLSDGIDVPSQFWTHFTTVTGITVPITQDNFIRCSC